MKGRCALPPFSDAFEAMKAEAAAKLQLIVAPQAAAAIPPQPTATTTSGKKSMPRAIGEESQQSKLKHQVDMLTTQYESISKQLQKVMEALQEKEEEGVKGDRGEALQDHDPEQEITTTTTATTSGDTKNTINDQDDQEEREVPWTSMPKREGGRVENEEEEEGDKENMDLSQSQGRQATTETHGQQSNEGMIATVPSMVQTTPAGSQHQQDVDDELPCTQPILDSGGERNTNNGYQTVPLPPPMPPPLPPSQQQQGQEHQGQQHQGQQQVDAEGVGMIIKNYTSQKGSTESPVEIGKNNNARNKGEEGEKVHGSGNNNNDKNEFPKHPDGDNGINRTEETPTPDALPLLHASSPQPMRSPQLHSITGKRSQSNINTSGQQQQHPQDNPSTTTSTKRNKRTRFAVHEPFSTSSPPTSGVQGKESEEKGNRATIFGHLYNNNNNSSREEQGKNPAPLTYTATKRPLLNHPGRNGATYPPPQGEYVGGGGGGEVDDSPLVAGAAKGATPRFLGLSCTVDGGGGDTINKSPSVGVFVSSDQDHDQDEVEKGKKGDMRIPSSCERDSGGGDGDGDGEGDGGAGHSPPPPAFGFS